MPGRYEAEHEGNDHRKERAQYGVQHQCYPQSFTQSSHGKIVPLKRVAQETARLIKERKAPSLRGYQCSTPRSIAAYAQSTGGTGSPETRSKFAA
jgi:hypothetical protein